MNSPFPLSLLPLSTTYTTHHSSSSKNYKTLLLNLMRLRLNSSSPDSISYVLRSNNNISTDTDSNYDSRKKVMYEYDEDEADFKASIKVVWKDGKFVLIHCNDSDKADPNVVEIEEKEEKSNDGLRRRINNSNSNETTTQPKKTFTSTSAKQKKEENTPTMTSKQLSYILNTPLPNHSTHKQLQSSSVQYFLTSLVDVLNSRAAIEREIDRHK